MNKHNEISTVKELGEKIGYGNMMSICSALWRKQLKESGTPESGAFIAVLPFQVKIKELNRLKESLINDDERI